MFAALERKIQRASRLDIAFVLDCTASMTSCFDEVRRKIRDLVLLFTNIYSNVSVRLALIGYRDHYNHENRLIKFPFTTSTNTFLKDLESLKLIGNQDDAEDVLGALHSVLSLDWKGESRILFHVGDGPCHGSDFHDEKVSDDYLNVISGLNPYTILNQLKSLQIDYYFGRVSPKTDKMISKFNELVPSEGNFIRYVNYLADDSLINDNFDLECPLPEDGTLHESINVTNTENSVKRWKNAIDQYKVFNQRLKNKREEGKRAFYFNTSFVSLRLIAPSSNFRKGSH